jgi:hypothetical protein
MTGMDRTGREGETPLDRAAGAKDWMWALGLLIGLGGVAWMFDRCLDFF